AFEQAFHGRTMGSLALTGKPALRAPFEPMLPGVEHLPTDLDALEAALGDDVAALVLEPIKGEAGVVPLPDGFLTAARALTARHGTLLIIDETHTFSAGPGGMTTAYDLEPDLVVIGKAIGGGIPTGAYGLSAEFAERALARTDLDLVDMGGVGGTLAGNPVSVAAMRATLEHVLTDEAFAHMIDTATYFTDGVNALFDRYDLPWAINQLGARAEYRFARPYPLNGTQAAEAADGELEDMIHLYLANRGIMLTPFHNMALMAPMTSRADVDAHHRAFEAAIVALVAK
ncbi:MAG: aminotransferase class III-fold pyridoxal phosphate-dependent enzyme, partial [Actinomycetes bacterium]